MRSPLKRPVTAQSREALQAVHDIRQPARRTGP